MWIQRKTEMQSKLSVTELSVCFTSTVRVLPEIARDDNVNKDEFLPNILLKRSCAVLVSNMKNSEMKRNSLHALSTRAYCTDLNSIS